MCVCVCVCYFVSSYVGSKCIRRYNISMLSIFSLPSLTNETSGDLNLTKLDRICFYFRSLQRVESYIKVLLFLFLCVYVACCTNRYRFYYIFVNPIPLKINSCFYFGFFLFFSGLWVKQKCLGTKPPGQIIFLDGGSGA